MVRSGALQTYFISFMLAPTLMTIYAVVSRMTPSQEGGGDDIINGVDGDDTLAGGSGDDILIGGHGSDVFLFFIGDGSDRIVISDVDPENSTDKILLGDDILDSNVSVRREDYELLLKHL